MYPVYRGVTRQYGYGLGSMFKAAIKTALPIIKPIVKQGINSLKREGIKHGLGLAEDVLLRNKKTKDVILSRGKRIAKSLGKSLLKTIGIKTNSQRQKRHSRSRRVRGKVVRKRTKPRNSRVLDIFD